MAPKRLLENPPSASSSSGEEGEESAREENPLLDSETESDNNVSDFQIKPIVPKSAMRVDPEPERSSDSKVIVAAADDKIPKKKSKKMKAEKGKSSVVTNRLDQKSSDPSKKVKNVVPNTDVADDEMAEPRDEPTLRVVLGLPSQRALEKKPKTNKSGKKKSKLEGDDKIVALSKRSKGKEKVTVREAEKIESLTGGLKDKKEVGDENEQADLSFIGDEKGVWWKDLSKVDSEKADELKEKWKQLRKEELELFVLKNELLKENAFAVLDALKASNP